MSTDMQIAAYRPKYILMSDMIREQIIGGNFRKGDRLPPDAKLALKYRVNARTVATGLNMLVKEGLLERAPGRGTIVIKDAQKGKIVSNAVAMVMLSKGDVYSKINLEISKGLGLRKLYPVLINENVIADEHCVKNYLDGMVGEDHRPYGFVIDGGGEIPYDYIKSNLERLENIVFITKYNQPEKSDPPNTCWWISPRLEGLPRATSSEGGTGAYAALRCPRSVILECGARYRRKSWRASPKNAVKTI